jgi:hypothetical protein
MRPVQRIGPLQLEILGHDAVIPAQPEPAELDLPATRAELLHNALFQPVGQADVIEEKAKNDDHQHEKQHRDAAPFEGGENNAPAPAPGRLRYGFLRRGHAVSTTANGIRGGGLEAGRAELISQFYHSTL